MAYDDYKRMRVWRDGKIIHALIDNPPVNVMTLELFADLNRLGEEVGADESALVLVLKSANPDFFIAHYDVGNILERPIDKPATRERSKNKAFHQMVRRFATMNKVTIAQIEGRVGGGGSELCMNFDMRFGVRGRAIINQMEVPLGILPGGSGTQMLPRLIGRNRAMEIILGGVDMNWDEAERWGYLNKVCDAKEISHYVDRLSRRIASFPPESVRLAKQAINASALPLQEGLDEEAYLFDLTLRTEDARRNMAKFLEIGGQTRDGELRVAELSRKLGEG